MVEYSTNKQNYSLTSTHTTRKDELALFFTNLKNYVKETNSISINEVYSFLTNYDLDDINNRYSFVNEWKLWQERYQNNPNMQCFVSDPNSEEFIASDPVFLRFNNKPNTSEKHLKMYVSVHPEAIYHTVNQIFDYIANEDISTVSKVSNIDRSDAIVLKVNNSYDAYKVTSFINQNKYITENARRTNPFLQRDGIVGVAYDDTISYNMTTSMMIAGYTNDRIRSNALEDISISDFTDYLNAFYESTFEKKVNLENFKEQGNEMGRYIMDDELINYMYCIKLLKQSITGEEDYKKFDFGYDDYKNTSKNERIMTEFNEVLDKNKEYLEKEQIVADYIKEAYKEYGNNSDLVSSELIAFATTKNYDFIENEQFRSLMQEKNITGEDIIRIADGNIREKVDLMLDVHSR